jgi:hypothetical protein
MVQKPAVAFLQWLDQLHARIRKYYLLAVGFFVILFSYTNCEQSSPLVPLDTVRVQAAPLVQNVQVNFCDPPAAAQNTAVKTLIILDHSGSNYQNYKMAADGSGAPDVTSGNVLLNTSLGTDPLGNLRYGSATAAGTLLNYLATLPANDPIHPQHYFALVDFNLDAPINNTSKPGGSAFTSDINGFYQSVLSEKTANGSGGRPNDVGGTSYISALKQATTLITNDIKAAEACAALSKTAAPSANCPTPGLSVASSYVVVFMSDGSPIILTGLVQSSSGQITQNPFDPSACPYPQVNLGNGLICKESTDQILGMVGQLAHLSTNRRFVAGVNVFTLYYYVPGNIDTSSQTLLQQMASAGNGISYSALSGSNIQYSLFQPPQQQAQFSLQDVFVTNKSGVWWTDGKFYLDSDGDGLPDFIEQQWGSDPLNAYTAGNGVSDSVRYALNNGAACKNMGANGICADPVTDYRANGLACNGLATTPDPAHPGAYFYKSTDPNGMNDCEKFLLNDPSGIGYPDSNGDFIPDWLEFINAIPFQSGTNASVNTPQMDGYSLYQKVKLSLPTSLSITNISPQPKPAQYQLTTTSTSNSGQTCYSLTVNGLPMVSPTDKIRVDVIFKANLTSIIPPYKVGVKSFSPGLKTLIFNDWTDPTEISNNTWSVYP